MARAFPAHLADDTISTKRSTPTLTTSGANIETFATNLTGVKAGVQITDGQEVDEAGAMRWRAAGQVLAADANDIVVTDKIVHGGRDYRITGIEVPYRLAMKVISVEWIDGVD